MRCSLLVPATVVVVWDSQFQDGFKCSRDAADKEKTPGKKPRPAAACWDGKKSSSVIEELLKNATDKAYGTEGEVNLVLPILLFAQTILLFTWAFSSP